MAEKDYSDHIIWSFHIFNEHTEYHHFLLQSLQYSPLSNNLAQILPPGN